MSESHPTTTQFRQSSLLAYSLPTNFIPSLNRTTAETVQYMQRPKIKMREIFLFSLVISSVVSVKVIYKVKCPEDDGLRRMVTAKAPGENFEVQCSNSRPGMRRDGGTKEYLDRGHLLQNRSTRATEEPRNSAFKGTS